MAASAFNGAKHENDVILPELSVPSISVSSIRNIGYKAFKSDRLGFVKLRQTFRGIISKNLAFQETTMLLFQMGLKKDACIFHGKYH